VAVLLPPLRTLDYVLYNKMIRVLAVVLLPPLRTLDYVMNLDTYNSLPPDIRTVFDKNSGMLWSVITGKIFDSCLQRSADFLNARDPPTYTPPEVEFARWQKAWEPVYAKAVAELEAQGINGTALLARMRELSKRYSDYRMGGYGSY
jgi:TRAP-type C4-dicarboxylate transport system substrate-binding protein